MGAEVNGHMRVPDQDNVHSLPNDDLVFVALKSVLDVPQPGWDITGKLPSVCCLPEYQSKLNYSVVSRYQGEGLCHTSFLKFA